MYKLIVLNFGWWLVMVKNCHNVMNNGCLTLLMFYKGFTTDEISRNKWSCTVPAQSS